MEKAILEEIEPRFALANSAPICQGNLLAALGTLAYMDEAEKILLGSFVPPLGMDRDTALLLEEVS